MKTQSFEVDNIKCNGCATSIKNKIGGIEGVEQVVVNLETETVLVRGALFMEDAVWKALKQMGYPAKGTSNTVQKVKSYVSCAVGKMQN